jgi:hypothetical protein
MASPQSASLILAVALTTAAASAATPGPYASSVGKLQARMQVMLRDIAHGNQQAQVTLQPDQTGLRTIVRITVNPAWRAQLQGSLTQNVNDYIAIHKGDCRPNTPANLGNAIPLNPLVNGVSQTNVNVPLSTLTGHGNVITTTSNGTVVNCGSL